MPENDGSESDKKQYPHFEEDINNAILRGTPFENGKQRIIDYFSENHTAKEKADYLKNAYGTGGRSATFIGDRRGQIWYDGKGLQILYSFNQDPNTRISWSNAARRIDELIENGRYFEWQPEGSPPLIRRTPYQPSLLDGLEIPDIDDDMQPPTEPSNIAPSAESGESYDKAEEKKPYSNDISSLPFIPDTLPLDMPSVSVEDEPAQDEPAVQDKPISVASDYIILPRYIPEGGAKTRYRNNVRAIRTLQAIEKEGRTATPEEQQILAGYVGWGGLANVFDSRKEDWREEYQELRELLSPDEYAKARGSTLNAHYTTPIIITSMYTALERFGFTGGNVLEPAMGTGHFFGCMPAHIRENCRLTGVELDRITGRIARQLYPHATIHIRGFEETELPDNGYDVVAGNVPFGAYQVNDPKYNRHNFFIHDYFVAKALDKVRPGGMVAVITTKGTLDKANDSVRQYLAQRAHLVGAIRLPNTAFKQNAGTEVTTDILFLQKRDHMEDAQPDWLKVGTTPEGVPVNQYFVDNPHMLLGTMAFDRSMYGNETETTCVPFPGSDLAVQLQEAISHLDAVMTPSLDHEYASEGEPITIPADPGVKNYSYTLVNDDLYYRENAIMIRQDLPGTQDTRIRDMIALRTAVRGIIDVQVSMGDDDVFELARENLNDQYDRFVKAHGTLSSRGVRLACAQDADYPLLASLEITDDEGSISKADMFFKRTIRPTRTIDHADTSAEALTISLNEKGAVDIPYMARLTKQDEDTVITDLQGVIFRNPATWNGDQPYDHFETADGYLSGNVRSKLKLAEEYAKLGDRFAINVEYLRSIQPEDLTAGEIEVRLGATWIPTDDIRDFTIQTFGMNRHNQIQVDYDERLHLYKILHKELYRYMFNASQTYGTSRMDGFTILENTLNLKRLSIYDNDPDGTRHFNQKATVAVREKQRQLQALFKDWIFDDPNRRNRLVALYNERFNNLRQREYDGSHLTFPGMNPELTLRPHQRNAVARILYGGNTLLAHEVGAGKSFVMVAAGMELKRLGLSNKILYVVPNHLVEQMGGELMRLYPSANLLLATKQDFRKENRQRFVSRIATGEYDGIVIGHASFERIGISPERMERLINQEIDEIIEAVSISKEQHGRDWTVKLLERKRKSLEVTLEKLLKTPKDNQIDFESLGIDTLMVDESQGYKNLFLTTKMSNVAGVPTSASKKSSDMYAKIQYLSEQGGRVVFATGTPISNTLAEMYTVQRYLQPEQLEAYGLTGFDEWVSTFGETITALELTPEGDGFRQKERLARFYNLPELMSLFRQVADIQTQESLNLPRPALKTGKPQVVMVKASPEQKEIISQFAERAESCRSGGVDPKDDNLLKITTEGRAIATDIRLLIPAAEDRPDSKLNAMIGNVYSIWEETKSDRLTQMIFCDMGTPTGSGFNLYADMKEKLIDKGIPEKEIAFIHDAKTDKQKDDLFHSVRTGDVRILIGSTPMMGTGTNCQTWMIALHELDVPWRPDEITQREGRILRQGNNNPEVSIFRYVTESTFDSYSWQLIEAKHRFFAQIMTNKSIARTADNIDDAALSYAEIKALATGNPKIREKMEVDMEVQRLIILKQQYNSTKYSLQDDITIHLPKRIADGEERIEKIQADIALRNEQDNEEFKIIIGGRDFDKRPEAAELMYTLITTLQPSQDPVPIGIYRGFQLLAERTTLFNQFALIVRGRQDYKVTLGDSALGNLTRLENCIKEFDKMLERAYEKLDAARSDLENSRIAVQKPFTQQERLDSYLRRQAELNAELGFDKGDDDLEFGNDRESGEADNGNDFEDEEDDLAL